MEESLPRFETLPARLFIVMGVAGCGKSSVGTAIARKIDGQYLEGDEYHPESNVTKMSDGIALTDEDRWPWLTQIGMEMAAREGVIVAGCSALKRSYRAHLVDAAKEPILFIYLHGLPALIERRMASRLGHFMPTSLLKSQFDTLEMPHKEEFAVTVDIDQSIEKIVAQFKREIDQSSSTNGK